MWQITIPWISYFFLLPLHQNTIQDPPPHDFRPGKIFTG
jgi:hypothetical protein